MKKNSVFALLTCLLFLFSGCVKDELRWLVRFEADSTSPNNVAIQYTNTEGGISGGRLSEINWKVEADNRLWYFEFTANYGDEVYLYANSLNKTKIKIKFQGIEVGMAETESGVGAEIKYIISRR